MSSAEKAERLLCVQALAVTARQNIAAIISIRVITKNPFLPRGSVKRRDRFWCGDSRPMMGPRGPLICCETDDIATGRQCLDIVFEKIFCKGNVQQKKRATPTHHGPQRVR
jgi:hypothetical protein